MTERPKTPYQQPLCGAQDWAYDDDDEPFIYGTCEKPKGHEKSWHTQYTPGGHIWAEWRGPADERAPEGARDGFLGNGPHDLAAHNQPSEPAGGDVTRPYT